MLEQIRERMPKIPFMGPSDPEEVSTWERWIARNVLALDGRAPMRVVLWNGETFEPTDGDPISTMRVNDRSVMRDIVASPDLAVGDAFVDGRITLEGDLTETLIAVFSARNDAPGWAKQLARLSSARPRVNTRGRSRDNVHHHYDVGNTFYEMWLDELLLYTCAYFPTKEATLEEAQLAKMDHVCRKIRLRRDETVVEVGCGWGSLALHMAEKYGAQVRAFNVSREQIKYARAAAKRRGLQRRVEFVEDDYRNASGRYDAFVSVGMLEHVGRSHYATLGRVMDRSLTPNGRGLYHSIGRSKPMAMNAWMERRIFPGAYIPSLRQMLRVIESVNLAPLDVENIRLHYALTLKHWLDRLEKHEDEIVDMYDEKFFRTYQLYLASSIAAFKTGSTHLYQVVFSRPSNNEIPWTRDYMYRDEDEA